MNRTILTLAVTTALVALGGCNSNSGNGNAATPDTQTSEAQKAAGDKTITSGLAADTKFIAAAKAAGLDQTLAGPGPYTVIVPDDAAFNALPAGTYDDWVKPANRAQLTGVMTNLILPGTVLAEDIGKAIDAGKGKAVLATMGGGTLTATKDGATITLTDSEGHKATVTKADDKFTNGVVHHVNAVLMPSAQQNAAAPTKAPTG